MNALLLAPLALLLLASCSGGNDPRELADEGSKALSSGQYESAAKSFEGALQALGSDTSSSEWLRAKMGLIRAHVRMDPSKAREEFLALAKGNPTRVADKDYSLIGGQLADAGSLKEATKVLEEGIAAHPESPQLKGLRDEIGKKAESSGDAGVLDAIRGLGYASDK